MGLPTFTNLGGRLPSRQRWHDLLYLPEPLVFGALVLLGYALATLNIGLPRTPDELKRFGIMTGIILAGVLCYDIGVTLRKHYADGSRHVFALLLEGIGGMVVIAAMAGPFRYFPEYLAAAFQGAVAVTLLGSLLLWRLHSLGYYEVNKPAKGLLAVRLLKGIAGLAGKRRPSSQPEPLDAPAMTMPVPRSARDEEDDESRDASTPIPLRRPLGMEDSREARLAHLVREARTPQPDPAG